MRIAGHIGVGLRLGLACACAGMPAHARAQAPDADWLAFDTPHYRVTFEAGLEPIARHAAAVAEGAYALYARTLTAPPEGPIELLVSDHADFTNAFATPIPSNRIQILATPPVDNLELAYHRDWVELAVLHELAHVFHRDQAGPIGDVVRAVFGRLPIGYPAFPSLFTPGWSVEGLATELESRHTGAGRVHGTYFDMVLRTAALRDRLAPIDRASHPSPVWPEGLHAYAYGSLFLDHLSDTFGADAMASLVEATATATLSPAWFFDRVGQRAFGQQFTDLWEGWLDEVRADARASIAAASVAGTSRGGLASERITHHGRYAARPRVSPDGTRLLYAASTGRDDPATRILALPGGRELRRVRLNAEGSELGPASWLPDGSGFVFSQFERNGPYRLYEDLFVWREGQGTTRLTWGARLSGPDVAPDGRRVVAVRNGGGGTALVVFDLRTGGLDTLVAAPGADWAMPRWSPDGSRIAVSRWADGAQDIVVIDTAGEIRRRVTDDLAVDRVPAWSPDGLWLLFASDRSGASQIYAAATADAARAPLRQVTHVLTGAFDPDVSPDGHTLYFVEYDADGFHVHRAPFEPASWLAPEPVDARFRRVDQPPRLGGGLVGDVATSPVVDYSALPSLRPYAWLPVLETGGVRGTAFGAAIFGTDVVERHTYSAGASWAPETERTEWVADYEWAGLGNPVLSARVERDWELDGRLRLETPTGEPAGGADVAARTDELALDATLLRRQWRGTAALVLGGSRIIGRRELDDVPGVTLTPELRTIDRWSARAVASYTNARRFVRSIAAEEGATLVAGIERTWDAAPDERAFAEEFTEYRARVSAYEDVRVFGFADHVVAARLAGLLRSGVASPLTSAGGAPGGDLDLGIASIGDGRYLHARGYAEGARAGTRGWSASVEYRLPIALVARGLGLLPVFLESASAAVFIDAADAWCSTAQIQRGRCGPDDVRADQPLLGTGLELRADVGAYFNAAVRVRAGVGLPLVEPHGGVRAYIAFGPAF